MARRAVPGARVRSAELEEEGGRLLYSFDLERPGHSGVEEVQVSADDGRVIGQHHETLQEESAEHR